MGQVYRAVDSSLGRAVAIKVLPDAFARDADRLARFEREAKTLASLNHPNIAQVFGLERGGPDHQANALVMELVEGPTLADRIANGPLPIDEAVPIAIQIAEALESAHDLGIIHRDLKPANVKVRDDGTVKVLDFGLAKAMAPAGELQSGTLANSPTITSPAMTQAGMILGTAAYMSPEQAKGRVVDRRADVWAFGCVLFEMITGKRAFAGEDISDVLVSILRDEPAWNSLPATTPPHMRALLQRCLQKDVKKRLPHIGVARLELGDDANILPTLSVASRSGIRILPIGLGGVVLGAAIAFAATLAFKPETTTPEPLGLVRFEILPPQGQMFPGANGVPRFTISPDGNLLAYETTSPGRLSQLWIRRLDATDPLPLQGAEGPSDLSIQQPFFSPDSKTLAYFDELAGKLKRVDVEGGPVEAVCDVKGNQFGGSWHQAGGILFASIASQGIQRLAIAGSKPVAVTTSDRARTETHLFPEWLPDGRHFVYLSTTRESSRLFVASSDGGAPKHLVDTAAQARFAPPNWLLYSRGVQLVAQALDLDRLELVGPIHVIDDSVAYTSAGRTSVSASTTGALTYVANRQGFANADADAFWVDRTGRPVPDLESTPLLANGLRLSHDGRLLAFTRGSGTRREQSDVLITDLARRVSWKLADAVPAGSALFAFSPDDSRLVFRGTSPTGGLAILEQVVSGASQPRVLLASSNTELASIHDLSPDGATMLFGINRSEGGGRSLRMLPMNGDAKPSVYLDLNDTGSHSAIAPNGRYVAYTSGSRDQFSQVFIQTFPDPSGGKWPVSRPGASHPRWSHDGHELYFVDAEARLIAVTVGYSPRLELGNPAPLFPLPSLIRRDQGHPYDVAPDGRFIVIRTRPQSTLALTVVLNWTKVLKTDAAAKP